MGTGHARVSGTTEARGAYHSPSAQTEHNNFLACGVSVGTEKPACAEVGNKRGRRLGQAMGGGARQQATRRRGRGRKRQERQWGKAGLQAGGSQAAVSFHTLDPTPIKVPRRKETPWRQTAAYLIHGRESSPRVGVWVVLLSRAQCLLIFILAPQHKQKSF